MVAHIGMLGPVCVLCSHFSGILARFLRSAGPCYLVSLPTDWTLWLARIGDTHRGVRGYIRTKSLNPNRTGDGSIAHTAAVRSAGTTMLLLYSTSANSWQRAVRRARPRRCHQAYSLRVEGVCGGFRIFGCSHGYTLFARL